MSERQHITIDPRVVTLDLSARDLDRMAETQRHADDPTLGAYAPDPDADYAQGVSDGYLLGLNDAPPIQIMPRAVTPIEEWVKLALACLFIGGLTWLALL